MSNLDALLITPPSRLEVYQGLANDYAAIEPPVWSSLIANYLIKKGYSAEVLDAEAENLTHEQTAEKIAKKKTKTGSIYGLWSTTISINSMYARRKKNLFKTK